MIISQNIRLYRTLLFTQSMFYLIALRNQYQWFFAQLANSTFIQVFVNIFRPFTVRIALSTNF